MAYIFKKLSHHEPGKDEHKAVLEELVVTKNGVYDDLDAHTLTIAVGETITFKEKLNLTQEINDVILPLCNANDGYITVYNNHNNYQIDINIYDDGTFIVSDWGGDDFHYYVSETVIDKLGSDLWGYGITEPGWYLVKSDNTYEPCEPLSVTIENDDIVVDQYTSVDLFKTCIDMFKAPRNYPIDGWNKVTVDVPVPTIGEITVTENGTYKTTDPVTATPDDIVVGKTISFNNVISIPNDIIDTLYETANPYEDYKCVAFNLYTDSSYNIAVRIFENGISVCLTYFENNNPKIDYAYIPETLTSGTNGDPYYGITTPGWHKADYSTYQIASCNPPSFMITNDDTIDLMKLAASSVFGVESGIGGWDKVTVKVPGAGMVVDVDELPATGVNHNKVYRIAESMPTSAAFYVNNGSTVQTVEALIPGPYYGFYIPVDTIPEVFDDAIQYIIAANCPSNRLPILVSTATGEAAIFAWGSITNMAQIVNACLGDTEFEFHGLAQSVEDMTEAGFYTMIINEDVVSVYGIPNADDSKTLFEYDGTNWNECCIPVFQDLTVSENGTYNVPENVDGFKTVSVDVPKYVPVTEPLIVKENGTYNVPEGIDGFSSVEIDVQPTLETKTVTENGTYTVPEGVDGYSSIEVDVNPYNIATGLTPPTDTSKLWVECDTSEDVYVVSPTSSLDRVFGTVPFEDHCISKSIELRELGRITSATVGTKVYLFGGCGASLINSDAISVFDMETEKLITLDTTLPEATYNMTSAVVGTKVYLFGGYGGSRLNTINVFDTETHEITTLDTTLPEAASQITSATVGTKVYLFGGKGASNLDTIYTFDTETNTITKLDATLPEVAYGITSAVVGTKVYLFGGYSSSYLNTIHVFNTETNEIITLDTTLPAYLNGIASATIGTKVYLFGGVGSNTGSSTPGQYKTIYTFDAETNTITKLDATLPVALDSSASAVMGANVYLFGGNNGTTSKKRSNAIYVFNATTGTTRLVLDITSGLMAHMITPAVVGKNVYLFGGYNGSTCYNTINVFNTETHAITTLDTIIPEYLYYMTPAVVGTKVYLFGGYGSYGNYQTDTNTIYTFDTETNAMAKLTTILPSNLVGAVSAVIGTKVYLFGGYTRTSSKNTTYYNTIHVFDTETHEITTLDTTLNSKVAYMSSATVGTKVYLFGGYSGSYFKTIYVFDAETNTITKLDATLPNGVYKMAAALVGTKVCLFSGITGDTSAKSHSNTIIVFDIETHEITTLNATLPHYLRDIASAVVDEKVYLFGGSYRSTPTATSYSNYNRINIFGRPNAYIKTNDLIVVADMGLNKNVCALVNGMDVGVTEVYIGNENNRREQVNAYLYTNDTWTTIYSE